MVKLATIIIVLTTACSSKWTIKQLDVLNAFLNSELEERVFMQRPPSIVSEHFPDHVFQLKKVPRAWFTTLSSTL